MRSSINHSRRSFADVNVYGRGCWNASARTPRLEPLKFVECLQNGPEKRGFISFEVCEYMGVLFQDVNCSRQHALRQGRPLISSSPGRIMRVTILGFNVDINSERENSLLIRFRADGRNV